MAIKTAIEWTDATWSPIRARVRMDAVDIANARGWKDLAGIVARMAGHVGPHCEQVSPGCHHCYSLNNNGRCLPSNGTGLPFDKRSRALVEIFVDEKALLQPLQWKQSKKIFVENQSDLFGEWATSEMIDKAFAIMALCPQHTFQVLTKRPERMLEYLDSDSHQMSAMMAEDALLQQLTGTGTHGHAWPLPNVWLGVSVENQEYADKRIPLLLQTPAALRFVSYEPALGPINFREFAAFNHRHDWLTGKQRIHPSLESTVGPRLGWIIVGGESGPGARPFNVQWARNVVKQCKAANVPVFVKQMGSNAQECNDNIADVWLYADGSDMQTEALDADSYKYQGSPVRLKLNDRKGGDPQEWPEGLRVREFPEPLNVER